MPGTRIPDLYIGMRQMQESTFSIGTFSGARRPSPSPTFTNLNRKSEYHYKNTCDNSKSCCAFSSELDKSITTVLEHGRSEDRMRLQARNNLACCLVFC